MTSYTYRKQLIILKVYKKVIGSIFIGGGVLLLLYFFLPVISWQIYFSSALASSDIETPIPKSLLVGKASVGELLAQGISNLATNYADARSWFPDLATSVNTSKVNSYLLSIPKIAIDNAVVSTIDYDLSSHLVQYAGTAVPGENGTSVIFGHSSLPQLFDSDNYKTIFSKLHTLQVGDEIKITAQGATYTYKIYTIVVSNPDDTRMFTQEFDTSNITLVTCTPPGTVWKRLVIKAKIKLVGEKTQKVS